MLVDVEYQTLDYGVRLIEHMRQHDTPVYAESIFTEGARFDYGGGPPHVVQAVMAARAAARAAEDNDDREDSRLKHNLDVLIRMTMRQRRMDAAEREDAWLDPETGFPRGGIPNRYGGIPNRYAR